MGRFVVVFSYYARFKILGGAPEGLTEYVGSGFSDKISSLCFHVRMLSPFAFKNDSQARDKEMVALLLQGRASTIGIRERMGPAEWIDSDKRLWQKLLFFV